MCYRTGEWRDLDAVKSASAHKPYICVRHLSRHACPSVILVHEWMRNLRHLSVHDKSSGAKLINRSLQLLMFPARSLTTSADTSPSPHGAFAFVSRAPRGEGVTRVVNISHSHLHDTIDHACHLGSCLVLERRLAPQLFHICSCGSFDAAGRPWESRVTATAHTSHLLWILSWSPRSLRGR